MKKLSILLVMCLMATIAKAQVWGNAQAMYDFGHKYATITGEIGHNHKSGNGFGFFDLDLGRKADNGIYFEYGYNFKLKNNFYAHVEYDGGVLFNSGITYSHAALLGGAYQTVVNKTYLEFQLKYRMDIDYRMGDTGHGLQATAVWNRKFFNEHLYFGGYIDLAYNATVNHLTYSTEIQLLYCLKRFGIGIELEMENYVTDFKASPKLMVKYDF